MPTKNTQFSRSGHLENMWRRNNTSCSRWELWRCDSPAAKTSQPWTFICSPGLANKDLMLWWSGIFKKSSRHENISWSHSLEERVISRWDAIMPAAMMVKPFWFWWSQHPSPRSFARAPCVAAANRDRLTQSIRSAHNNQTQFSISDIICYILPAGFVYTKTNTCPNHSGCHTSPSKPKF